MGAGLGLLGVVGLLFGVGLYSDVLGLTDYVSIRDGVLAVGLPALYLEGPFSTGLRVAGLYEFVEQWALPGVSAAAVLIMIAIVGHRRTFIRIVDRWPRGAHGIAAVGLTLGALLAFLPVGEGQRLAVSSLVLTLGFMAILAAIGGRAMERVGTHLTRRLHRFHAQLGAGAPIVLAALLACGGLLVAVLVFDRTPHVVDGISHLFQVQTFSEGALFRPSHPLAAFFDVNTIVNDGRWYTQYTPGHTFLLLIGSWVRAPWLVSPILGAAFLFATHALGRAMFDRSTAGLGALLLLLSPFVILMFGEYYSHTSAAVWVALSLLGYVRLVDGGGRFWAILSGMTMGLCILTRPLSALGCGMAVLVDVLVHRSELRHRVFVFRCIQAASTTLIFVFLLLAYNRLVGGEWTAFGYGRAHGPGFGTQDGISALPTLGRIQLLSDALFATPVPSLLLVLPAFLGRRPHRWDWLLLAVPVCLLLVHAPVGYRDDEFGPRYLFEGVGPLALLVARGLHGFEYVALRFRPDVAPVGSVLRFRGGIAIALLCAVVLLWAPRFTYYSSDSWKWAVRSAAGDAVDEAGLRNAIVFVSAHPLHGDRLFEAVFLRNAPDPGAGSVLYALDLGDRNGELIALYPDRLVYRFADGMLSQLGRTPSAGS